MGKGKAIGFQTTGARRARPSYINIRTFLCSCFEGRGEPKAFGGEARLAPTRIACSLSLLTLALFVFYATPAHAAPTATNFVVNGGAAVTDEQLGSGDFSFVMIFTDVEGIETVNDTAPFFIPEFDIVAPGSLVVLTNEDFESYGYFSAVSASATDLMHSGVAYDDVSLGTYTSRWSASSSNSAQQTVDSVSIIGLGNAIFDVVDDDTDMPLLGFATANLLVNSGFETNAECWIHFGAYATASVAAAESGNFGLILTNGSGAAAVTNSGYSQWIPVTANSSYQLATRARRVGLSGAIDALVAHWKMDEGSGAVAYDSAGNYDGTNISSYAWVSGYDGGGLSYASSAARMRLLVPLATGFTVSAWFKYPLDATAGGYNSLAQFSSSFAGAPLEMLWVRMSDQTIGTWPGAQTAYSLSGLAAGWHQLTVVAADGGQNQRAFYIDGALVANGTGYGAPLAYLTTLGNQNNLTSRRWGEMDEVKLFNRPLASNEVASLFSQNFVGLKIDHYGASGYISSVETNLLSTLSTSWQSHALSYTTPASTTSNNVNFYMTNSVPLNNGSYHFDIAHLGADSAAHMSLLIGGTVYPGSDSTTNAIFTITDEDILSIGAGTPLTFSFAAFDTLGGLSRGASDTNTETHINIENWITNNVTNYVSGDSTPFSDSMQFASTSLWKFNSADYDQLLGTNEIAVTLFDGDQDRPNDQAIRRNQRYGFLAVVDDDVTPPSNFNFNAANGVSFATNLVVGGLYITGQVQDAESGVLAKPNHTYSLVRDGLTTVSSGIFTNAPESDGDAMSSPGSLGVTIPGSIIEIPGAYTLYVTNSNYDLDRSGDGQTAVDVFTFFIGSRVGPWANAYTVNGGSDLTDQQLQMGAFEVDIELQHEFGVESTNVLAPFFVPDFDIVSPAGLVVLTNELFEEFAYPDAEHLAATDFMHSAVSADDVVLGVYTMRWSAVSSNGEVLVDSHTLSNSAAMTFNVIDDDTVAPVASAIDVKSGNTPVTDQELAGGLWPLTLDIDDASLVSSNDYRIVNPGGYAAIVSNGWDYITSVDADTDRLNVYVPSVAHTSIMLGTHAIQWSAYDNDSDRPGDRLGVTYSSTISGDSNEFFVVDDDTVAPPVPSNVVVTPATWTNVNAYIASWIAVTDASSIYQYRIATNGAKPSSATDGGAVDLTLIAPTAIPFASGDFEGGSHGTAVPQWPSILNNWSSFSKYNIGTAYWSGDAYQKGFRSMELTCPADDPHDGTAWASVGSMVAIDNTNGAPITVSLSGWFKGNMDYEEAGNKATAYLQIQCFSAYSDGGSNLVDSVDNRYGPGATPLAGINATDWSNVVLTATNLNAATRYVRLICGIAQHGNAVSITGYWDNLTATIQVASLPPTSVPILNASEGTQTNWLFAVDDDNDRENDRMISAVTNVLTMYDATAPAVVTMTNVVLGPVTNRQILVQWTPLADGGGTDLSPWYSYRIYYTDQGRDALTTDPYVDAYNGGPSDLSTISTYGAIISNLLPSVTYHFSVVGRDQAGNESSLPAASSNLMVGLGPPVLIRQTLNEGEFVTDADIASGAFEVEMEFFDMDGVSSTVPQPVFDIQNPFGTLILNNEVFDTFVHTDNGRTLTGTDASHAGAAYSDVYLGSYTTRFSVADSNVDYYVDTSVFSDGSPTVFAVIDEDIEPPLPSSVATNALKNPGFETAAAQWTSVGSYVGASASAAESGSYGIFITNALSSGYNAYEQWVDASANQESRFTVKSRARNLTFPLPTSYWKMDEGSGLTASDSIGGYDGTLSATVGWTTGLYNNAIAFTNGSAKMDVYAPLTTGFTFATWFKYPLDESVSTHNALACFGPTPGSVQQILWVQRDGELLGVYNGINFPGYSMIGLSDGWHHLAYVSGDGAATSIKIYIDGELVIDSASSTRSHITGIGNQLNSLGRRWGIIDDMRIYNTPLSADQVATLSQPAFATTVAHVGAKIDHYGAAGYLGSAELDTSGASSNWQEFALNFTTPANTTSNKISIFATNETLVGVRYDFDNAYLTGEGNVPMAVSIGDDRAYYSGSSIDAIHRITDGDLASVSAGTPLRLTLGSYDTISGQSRDTATATTNMNIDIGSWTTDNVANYTPSESSSFADSFLAGATSVWKFTSFAVADIDALMGTNLVAATMHDADADRAGDISHATNTTFGYLVVDDDDSSPPEAGMKGTNMLRNPSFETNAALWTVFGSYASASEEAAQTGDYGIRLTNVTGGGESGYFQWIDETGDQDRRLSIHASDPSAPEDWVPLIAYWPMDEASGTDVEDISGNGYDGELQGGALWTTNGHVGAAVNFLNNNQYMDVNLYLPPSWTVSAWFRYPLDQGNSGWNYLLPGIVGVNQSEGDRLGTHVTIWKPINYYLNVLSEGWHHIMVQGNPGAFGGFTRFYIDGEYVGQHIQNGWGGGMLTRVGSWGNNDTWGLLDEVMLFDGNLVEEHAAYLATTRGTKVEHYGPSGFLGSDENTLGYVITRDWKQHDLYYTTPAGTTSNKIMIYQNNMVQANGQTFFDNILVGSGDGSPMSVYIGSTEIPGSDNTRDAIYTLTDANITNITPATPIRFVFHAYDVGSGLSRGTTDDSTQTSLDIVNWVTNNITNYVSAESSTFSETYEASATNVWSFDGINSYDNLLGTNMIFLDLHDADDDRTGDQSVMNGKRFGYLAVADDDATAPLNFAFNTANGKVFLTNDVRTGLDITGLVWDAESGVVGGSANHVFSLVRDGTTVSNGVFTTAPLNDGDAMAAAEALEVTINGPIIEIPGNYTLYVTNTNYDIDRPGDSETASDIFTFIVATDPGPEVSFYISNSVSSSGYSPTIPSGFQLPDTVAPFVTTNMEPPYPTADWWTSILRVRGSGMLAARPLFAYTKPTSLDLRYPISVVDNSVETQGEIYQIFDTQSDDYHSEIRVLATGGTFPTLATGSAKVDAYGDFSVRVRVGGTNSYIQTDMAHGSPYMFNQFVDCDPLLDFPEGYTVEYSDTNEATIVVKIEWYDIGPRPAFTNHYAIFAPTNTDFTLMSTQIVPVIQSTNKFLAIAALPSRDAAYNASELALLRGSAYMIITNTTVDLAFEPTNAMVTATYSVQTESIQGPPTNTLMGMLPFHWKNTSSSTVTGVSYDSFLGDLRVFEGDAFTIGLRHKGIVPQFPAPTNAAWDLPTFESLADLVEPAGTVNYGADTYNIGKQFERVARVIPALDSLGLTNRLAFWLSDLRTALADMFSYEAGETNRFFAYEPTWGTLLGYQPVLGSIDEMNDHHFHYGMHVYSAAILGMYDKGFVTNYGSVVDKVIRDYNNPSRDTSGSDPLPWLRHFDPWEGHSWASGFGGARDYCEDCGDTLNVTNTYSIASHNGNDEESTSEAMNSWAAMSMWGEVSGNTEFRDMGIIGYTMEAQAIREYTYDADDTNRDPAFNSTMVSRLFGDRVDTTTFFSNQMQHAWGIQYILTGPHMTYQGHYAPYRAADYAYFTNNFQSGVDSISNEWVDIHYMYRCFFEADQVLAEYTTNAPVNNGNTEANLYYWVNVMNTIGEVDTNFYSDLPSMVIFTNSGGTNYIGYNYTDDPVTAKIYRCSDNTYITNVVLTNLSPQNPSVSITVSVTDGEVRSGNFPMIMVFSDIMGIETTNTLGAFFIPNYDLLSPAGVVVLTNEEFETFTYLSPTEVKGIDLTHVGVAYDDVVLGTYTTRWSAINSNANPTIDSILMSNSIPMTFEVIDDDVSPPLATVLVYDVEIGVTDADLLAGGWGLGMDLLDPSGIITNPADGIVPTYSLINPSGVVAMADQNWEFIGPKDAAKTSWGMGGLVEPIPWAGNMIGEFQIVWSAEDNDNDRLNDTTVALYSSALTTGSNTFMVTDDDSDPPPTPIILDITPVSWTNENEWDFTYEVNPDGSGIYQYRVSTSDTEPTSMTDGYEVIENFLGAPIPTAVVITNGGFEYGGAHGTLIDDYALPGTDSGWQRWNGNDTWWELDGPHEGSRMARLNHTGGAGWSLLGFDFNLTPYNPGANLPISVDFGGFFKGDMTNGRAFMKLEYFCSPAGPSTRCSPNWYSTDNSASPFQNTNVVNWTYTSINVTNVVPGAQWLRFVVGMRSYGPAITGFWDNVSATVRVASTVNSHSLFTNAIEGVRSNWVFVIDDDNDRPNDRLMSGITNFITMYDITPPDMIPITNAFAGPVVETQATIQWTPAPDGGGTDLSPWWTYSIYYTDEPRMPTNTDPVVTITNGGAPLGDITTYEFIISNLTAGGITYSFAVIGRDQAGNESPWPTNMSQVALSRTDFELSATQLVVNGGYDVTDEQMNDGLFDVVMHFYSQDGVESTNDKVGGFFTPDFDITTPSANVVLTNEAFSDFSYIDPQTLVATDSVHSGTDKASVELGRHRIQWSAMTSNSVSVLDATTLRSGAPTEFDVVDDDLEDPFGQGLVFNTNYVAGSTITDHDFANTYGHMWNFWLRLSDRDSGVYTSTASGGFTPPTYDFLYPDNSLLRNDQPFSHISPELQPSNASFEIAGPSPNRALGWDGNWNEMSRTNLRARSGSHSLINDYPGSGDYDEVIVQWYDFTNAAVGERFTFGGYILIDGQLQGNSRALVKFEWWDATNGPSSIQGFHVGEFITDTTNRWLRVEVSGVKTGETLRYAKIIPEVTFNSLPGANTAKVYFDDMYVGAPYNDRSGDDGISDPYANVQLGDYTIRWSGMDCDNDRTADPLSVVDATSITGGYTITMVDEDTTPPVATSINLNAGSQIYDQNIRVGIWNMRMELWDQSGTELTNNLPAWAPNYSLINHAGVTVIVTEAWDIRTNISSESAALTEFVPPVAYTNVTTGNYSIVYSALDGDQDRAGDPTATTNDSTITGPYSLTFEVLDEDVTPPTAPTNFTVEPASWTNTNYFVVSWNSSIDSQSGISEYRYSTNVNLPTLKTDGTNLALSASGIMPIDVLNESFETGFVGEVLQNGATVNSWTDYGSGVLEQREEWSDVSYSGSNGLNAICYAGNNDNFALFGQVIPINNPFDLPVDVTIGGWFRGNLAYTNIGFSPVALMKIEFLDAGMAIQDVIENQFAAQGYPRVSGQNVTQWTNTEYTATNRYSAKFLRVMWGLHQNFNDVEITGHWDNVYVKVGVYTADVTSAIFTNRPEGTTTSWLFSIDNDVDRPDDRLMSPVSNFVTRLDMTPPGAVTIVNVLPGPDPDTEVRVDWNPLPDGGGTELSPWDTYIFYYTDEDRDPTNTDDSILFTNGPASLTDVSTASAILSNFTPGLTYNIRMSGRDRAGNEGPLSTVWQIGFGTFSMTQGIYHVDGAGVPIGVEMSWEARTNSEGFIAVDYDLIYVDAPSFGDFLTNDWMLLTTVSNTYAVDTGSLIRTPPTELPHNMFRFYRAAESGRWSLTNPTPAVSREVYVIKNLWLTNGHTFVSLFAEPQSNSVARVLGTNMLPAAGSALDSTHIQWFDSSGGENVTNDIYLLNDGHWYWDIGGGGFADHKPMPFSQGFNISISSNAPPGPHKLLILGKLTTNEYVETLQASGGQEFFVCSYPTPRRMKVSELNLEHSGFAGGPTRFEADEVRILMPGVGPFGSPRLRVYYDTDENIWKDSRTGKNAMNYYIEPDEAIIIYSRISAQPIMWTNMLHYTPPGKNMNP